MKHYLPLIIASALVLSGCSLPGKVAVNQNTQPTSTPEAKKETPLQSLKDLVAGNTTQKCTYSLNENNTKITGELFIKGKKFKQVSKVDNSKEIIDINVIGDGQYVYTWNNKMAGGLKFKMDPANLPTDSDNNNNSVDMDKKMNYQCAPADVADTEFDLPKDVKIMDFTVNLKDIQKNIPNLDKLKDLIPKE